MESAPLLDSNSSELTSGPSSKIAIKKITKTKVAPLLLRDNDYNTVWKSCKLSHSLSSAHFSSSDLSGKSSYPITYLWLMTNFLLHIDISQHLLLEIEPTRHSKVISNPN